MSDEAPVPKVTVEKGLKPGYVHVSQGGVKPPQEDIDELKDAGFLFTHGKKHWWGPIETLPERYHALAREAGLMV